MYEREYNFEPEILLHVLEDDATDTGGTAYAGETVHDFLDNFPDGQAPTTLEELNSSLIACGIRPIRLVVAKFEMSVFVPVVVPLEKDDANAKLYIQKELEDDPVFYNCVFDEIVSEQIPECVEIMS